MTLSEIKRFSTLPPEEKQRLLKEFESEINSKRNEWQAYNAMVRNSMGSVEHVKDLNPSLEHLNILRAEISNLEAELQKIGKYIDREEEQELNENDDDDNDDENPIIDQQAIGASISGNGVINIRPDIKLFRTSSKTLTYQQILEREAKKEACEKRDEIKEIIREIMNSSRK